MRCIPYNGGWIVELEGIVGNVVYKRDGTPRTWETQEEAEAWVKERVW